MKRMWIEGLRWIIFSPGFSRSKRNNVGCPSKEKFAVLCSSLASRGVLTVDSQCGWTMQQDDTLGPVGLHCSFTSRDLHIQASAWLWPKHTNSYEFLHSVVKYTCKITWAWTKNVKQRHKWLKMPNVRFCYPGKKMHEATPDSPWTPVRVFDLVTFKSMMGHGYFTFAPR